METLMKRGLIIDNVKRMRCLTGKGKEESAEFNALVGEIIPYIKEIISVTIRKFGSLAWVGKEELVSVGLEVFWGAYRKYKSTRGAGFITYFTKALSNKYLTMNWDQQGRPYRVSNEDKKYMRECKVETVRLKKLKSKIEDSEKRVARGITKDKMISLTDLEYFDGLFPGKENIAKDAGVKNILRYVLNRISGEDKSIMRELYHGCKEDRFPCHRAHTYLEKNNDYERHMATYVMRGFLSRMRDIIKDSGMDTEFVLRS